MRPLVTLAAACIAIPALAQSGLDDTRKRAKLQRFDATATIPCAQERGEAFGTCKAGVARNGSGTATVAATFPNGFARLLFFEDGQFLRGDTTMSGTGTDVDRALENGTYTIRVDDQRFVIPAAFVLGQ